MNLKSLLLAIAPAAFLVQTAAGVTVATYATNWSSTTTTGIATAGTAFSPSGYVIGGWETTNPGGNHTFVDVKASHSQVTGDRLFFGSSSGSNIVTATISLTGLPAFTSMNLDRFIVGAGGGIDHNQLDGIEVRVNGSSVLNIDLSARDRDGAGAPLDVGTYLAAAPAPVILEGWASTDTNGKEFISTRTDGWGHDALYDFGADPAFDNIAVSGSGNVTIEVISRLSNGSGGTEGGNDEQIVVGNFHVSFDAIPEPSSMVLLAAGALGLLRRRRV